MPNSKVDTLGSILSWPRVRMNQRGKAKIDERWEQGKVFPPHQAPAHAAIHENVSIS